MCGGAPFKYSTLYSLIYNLTEMIKINNSVEKQQVEDSSHGAGIMQIVGCKNLFLPVFVLSSCLLFFPSETQPRPHHGQVFLNFFQETFIQYIIAFRNIYTIDHCILKYFTQYLIEFTNILHYASLHLQTKHLHIF